VKKERSAAWGGVKKTVTSDVGDGRKLAPAFLNGTNDRRKEEPKRWKKRGLEWVRRKRGPGGKSGHRFVKKVKPERGCHDKACNSYRRIASPAEIRKMAGSAKNIGEKKVLGTRT